MKSLSVSTFYQGQFQSVFKAVFTFVFINNEITTNNGIIVLNFRLSSHTMFELIKPLNPSNQFNCTYLQLFNDCGLLLLIFGRMCSFNLTGSMPKIQEIIFKKIKLFGAFPLQSVKKFFN